MHVRMTRQLTSICVAEALLIGCSAAQPPIGTMSPTLHTQSHDAHSKTFKFTGKSQSFVVPTNVTDITVTADGASMPSGSTYDRGNGGLVEAVLPVNPGETLYVVVGGQGGENTGDYGGVGGFNGGGNGGAAGAYGDSGGYGGGGASDLREGDDGLANRVLVAGGAGGVGNGYGYSARAGGAGGGKIGGSGATLGCGFNNVEACGGKGGRQNKGGAGGRGGRRYGFNHGTHGQRGTVGAGGTGGGGSYNDSGGGGGGGGGWFGGGGGGAGSQGTSSGGTGGGGGGGSSYIEPNAAVLVNARGAAPPGNGEITISWSISTNK